MLKSRVSWAISLCGLIPIDPKDRNSENMHTVNTAKVKYITVQKFGQKVFLFYLFIYF